MTKEEIFEQLKNAVTEMDSDMAEEAANAAIEAGLDPLECIAEGLSAGMQVMSDLFDEGEAFVPELLMAAEAFEAATGILTGTLSDEEKAKLSSLPTTLEEALDALEADHAYLTEGGVFPEHLLQNFIAGKRAECAKMAAIPTPAEFMMYYNV